jgi:hypothetical protein
VPSPTRSVMRWGCARHDAALVKSKCEAARFPLHRPLCRILHLQSAGYDVVLCAKDDVAALQVMLC